MKRERVLSCLIGAALSFCLGFGGAACMVTGMNLPVHWFHLACGCAINTVLVVVCISFKRGGLAVGGIGLLMLLSGSFWQQAKALVRDIMDYYHRAYGIGIPDWLGGEAVTTQIQPLLLIAGLVTAAAAWTILRRKRSFLAVGTALLPLAACMVVTDTVPEQWAIFVFALGLVMLMMTQSLRRRDAVQANRLAGMLALPVMAALMLLFFLVPQGDYAAPEQMDSVQGILNWFGNRVPYVGQTSEGELVLSFGGSASDQVNLGSLGRNTMRSTPVMEVTAELSGQIYLRGRDYDVYDGKSWAATEDRAAESFGPPESLTRTNGQVTIKTLGRRGQYYLPYYAAGEQTLTGGMIANPEGQTEYSYECRCLRDTWQALWKDRQWAVYDDISSGADQADDRYLALPEETRQRAEAVLGTVISGTSDDQLELAELIGEYVCGSASYSLDTGRMPGSETDFAMWFLEESDTGYCVHFASAAVVLLRAAGIPARYVEGYVTTVEGGQTAIVRESMAHAWVEYFLEGVGWVILDPTPGSGDETVETTEMTPQTTERSTEETTLPWQTTEDTQSHIQSTLGTASASGASEENTVPGWFVTVLWVLAWTAGLGLLAMGQWALRRNRKLRRMYRGKANAQALARFREAGRMARLRKIPLPEELRRLAEKARFSPHVLTKEELARFDAFLRESVRELRKRPWYYRAVCRLVFAAY